MVTAKAWTRWGFCPALLWRFHKVVRDADFVTLHSLYSFPVLAGYLLARLHGKPYAIWPHGVLAPFMRGVSRKKKLAYNKLIANRILQHASVVVFSAEGERKETASLRLRPPSIIISEGFNAGEFAVLPKRGAFRARFLDGHTGPLVLFLARLHAKKGIDLLIQAMRRVVAEMPEVRLAIVGPPDPTSFHHQVMQLIKENGIESQTVVTGAASPEMRLQAFADSDVYVLPSYEENFGFTIFEAMASGLPVVVSDTVNFASEIAQSGAGFTLPRTPEAFSAAILTLLDQPWTRRNMGSCGRVLASQYSQERTGAKVEEMVRSILGGHAFPTDLAPALPSQDPFQLRI
jgi:glycosyltransferase involved in cell wall biosynthesis